MTPKKESLAVMKEGAVVTKKKTTSTYVVGFLFTRDLREVVLVLKDHPAWQRNKFNGVGGKVEDGEHVHDAMVREFSEETGVHVLNWSFFCELKEGENVVHFATAVSELAEHVKSPTTEKVFLVDVDSVGTTRSDQWQSWFSVTGRQMPSAGRSTKMPVVGVVVYNLPSFVMMALNHLVLGRKTYYRMMEEKRP